MLAGQALGQQTAQPAPIVTAVEPVRGAEADSYRSEAGRRGIETDATYASKVEGKLPTNGKFKPPKAAVQPRSGPVIQGGWGMILVLAIALGALALWLRFGGAGALLAATPGDIKPKASAPENWKLPDSNTLPSGDIYALIQGMQDRRAAMVMLLRTSLMRAAEISNTRFARSDTEREALRRLPKHLSARPVLAGLLQQAELAHYGGRDVSADLLTTWVDQARQAFGVPR